MINCVSNINGFLELYFLYFITIMYIFLLHDVLLWFVVFIVFKRFYSHVPNKLEEPTLVSYVLTRFGRVTLIQKPLYYVTVVRTRFSCTCSLAVSSFSTSCSRSCAGNIRVFIPSSVVPTRCLTICSLSSYNKQQHLTTC